LKIIKIKMKLSTQKPLIKLSWTLMTTDEENQASSNDDDEDDDDGSGDGGGGSEEEEEEPVCTDCGEQPCMFEEFVPSNLIGCVVDRKWLTRQGL
jgi:hypothetical protein